MSMNERSGSFSAESKRCQKCNFRDDCENKRLAACAYIIPEPIAASAMAEISMPIMADILIKHDYRDIKIDKTTTITIDLEDLKRELEKRHFPQLFQFGM